MQVVELNCQHEKVVDCLMFSFIRKMANVSDIYVFLLFKQCVQHITVDDG